MDLSTGEYTLLKRAVERFDEISRDHGVSVAVDTFIHESIDVLKNYFTRTGEIHLHGVKGYEEHQSLGFI